MSLAICSSISSGLLAMFLIILIVFSTFNSGEFKMPFFCPLSIGCVCSSLAGLLGVCHPSFVVEYHLMPTLCLAALGESIQ